MRYSDFSKAASGRSIHLVFAIAALMFTGDRAAGQQVTVQTPVQSVRDSFFESTGVSWQVNRPGFRASFGGTPAPPFGNANPNAGINFGFGNRNGNLRFNFAQGSQRSFVSTTPVLTVTNGVPGRLFSGTSRPFITSVIPVGGGNVGGNFLPNARPVFSAAGPNFQQRLNEARRQPAETKEAIAAPVAVPRRAIRAAPVEQQTPATVSKSNTVDYRKNLQRGLDALNRGKLGAASVMLKMAARSNDAELRECARRGLRRIEQQRLRTAN